MDKQRVVNNSDSKASANSLYERFHAKRRRRHAPSMERDFVYRDTCARLKPLLRPGMRVVDFGCGSGALACYCAMKGCEVAGYDISAAAVALARESAKRFGFANLEVFEADAANANLHGQADLAICSEVIEHLPNDRLFLANVFDSLDREGLLYLSAPSNDAPMHRMFMRFRGRDAFDEKVGHLRRYSDAQIKEMLEDAGFEILSMDRREGILRNFLFTTRPGRFIKIFIRGYLIAAAEALDKATWPFYGTSDIVAVARKRGPNSYFTRAGEAPGEAH